MSANKDLERGHLDSEDSLLNDSEPVEMQNPLKAASNLDTLGNTTNSVYNPNPNLFSDDEVSSEESSVNARCRASSECGSVMVGTFRHPPISISGGDEDGAVSPHQPAAAEEANMTDVDLGSTNRIMALRETNNNGHSSHTHSRSRSRSSNNPSNNNNNSSGVRDESGGTGSGSGGKAEAAKDCSTAEPSPTPMVPGDGPSGAGELTEVR